MFFLYRINLTLPLTIASKEFYFDTHLVNLRCRICGDIAVIIRSFGFVGTNVKNYCV